MSRTSHAAVPTAHASRYLQQLAKHWAHKFPVAFTPEAGTIDLPMGRLTLAASGAALSVALAGTEGADMARFETVVAEHLQRFGFREELVFEWQREGVASGEHP